MEAGKNQYAHKRLDLWRTAIDFVIEIYQLTESFPGQERYGLAQQMRRAAVSVPSNIAEGAGRESSKDMVRFLDIARGSIAEPDTQLELAARLEYVTGERFSELAGRLDQISRMLRGLRNTKVS